MVDVLKQEEESFFQTIATACEMLGRLWLKVGNVDGDTAFSCYDTYGFPPRPDRPTSAASAA